jgi:hypothetical protein
MKKFILITGVMLASFAASAQEVRDYDPFRDADFLKQTMQVSAIVIVIYLLSTFLLTVIRLFMDFRLKNKMIDKGASEYIVNQFLQPQKKDSRSTAIKWAIIVAGIGIGFTLMLLVPPFGIHSVMIMSFCVSLSFLCYYYFMKKTEV